VINQIQDDTGAEITSRTTARSTSVRMGRQGRGSPCHDQRHCQSDTAGEGRAYLGTLSRSPRSAPSSHCCPGRTACCTSPRCARSLADSGRERRGRAQCRQKIQVRSTTSMIAASCH
jgi:hypothetical protein